MQSLKKRFGDNGQEVLDYVDTWGFWEAREHYKVSFDKFTEWLKEKTGNEYYGMHGKSLGGSGGNDIVEMFIQKFADFVAASKERELKKDTTIERLREENGFLRERISALLHNHDYDLEGKLIPIMEACQS